MRGRLRADAEGGVAEDALAEEGEDAAAGALAAVGEANRLKVGTVSGSGGGVATVNVSEAEDVNTAALGVGVEAAAGGVDDLAGVDVLGGQGGDEAGEEGDDGNGELHFDGVFVLGFLGKVVDTVKLREDGVIVCGDVDE